MTPEAAKEALQLFRETRSLDGTCRTCAPKTCPCYEHTLERIIKPPPPKIKMIIAFEIELDPDETVHGFSMSTNNGRQGSDGWNSRGIFISDNTNGYHVGDGPNRSKLITNKKLRPLKVSDVIPEKDFRDLMRKYRIPGVPKNRLRDEFLEKLGYDIEYKAKGEDDGK